MSELTPEQQAYKDEADRVYLEPIIELYKIITLLRIESDGLHRIAEELHEANKVNCVQEYESIYYRFSDNQSRYRALTMNVSKNIMNRVEDIMALISSLKEAYAEIGLIDLQTENIIDDPEWPEFLESLERSNDSDSTENE